MTREEFIQAVKGYIEDEAVVAEKWGVCPNVSGYEYDYDFEPIGLDYGRPGYHSIRVWSAEMGDWSKVYSYES